MGFEGYYEIEMRLCFIVEYFNVKSVWSIRDTDTTVTETLLGTWLVPHPLPAMFFTAFVEYIYEDLEE